MFSPGTPVSSTTYKLASHEEATIGIIQIQIPSLYMYEFALDMQSIKIQYNETKPHTSSNGLVYGCITII